ncbi:hypothetical protein Cni_G15220 [Canna indica]|uniref:FPL domain-containing protein n=1 Tax=Canna indica TaxID=4628 RepID=A0AAQ3QBD1_9LILI|nr:hypothetical protein Cni_G15220 [Canna indica]
MMKDFIIEVLRSIAELITYGDQHDASYFELFMEKHIMREFIRILRISKSTDVSLQLLQTISIMIQNLRNEHSIYYIFSNNHINHVITYSFDFQNEELLSYYISFLRATSRELNKNTISLLVKTMNEEVVSFPLYVQAIEFAFHEENMVRIAVRAVTLNVYNVGDEYVNKYVKCSPQSIYFSNVIRYICKGCINLDELVAQSARKLEASDLDSSIYEAIDDIEDNLHYLSDIISAGVPDLGRLLIENILQLLVFPLLLPSLKKQNAVTQVSITTSLHILCSILQIVKSKDLASTIAAALNCPLEVFAARSEASTYGYVPKRTASQDSQNFSSHSLVVQENIEHLKYLSLRPNHLCSPNGTCGSHMILRELVLSYIVGQDESQVLASLCLLATLLQREELYESLLDGLGILPQKEKHMKLLLDKHDYHAKCEINPKIHICQVFNALVSLFCRSSISAEILWLGGWILRQLLPYGKEEFDTIDLSGLKDSHKLSVSNLSEESKGTWCDVLIALLKDEWRIYVKAIEASSPPINYKSILLSSQRFPSGDGSSVAAAGRMCHMVKVFVLQHQLLLFALGVSLPDLPYQYTPVDSPVISRTKTWVFDAIAPKSGSEISLVNALPCTISFERDTESDFSFLAISRGTSGWVILAEELPLKQQCGIIRSIIPLAGSDPNIDEEHPKWLHLRVRPSTLPFLDSSKFGLLKKGQALADGHWTLAFEDEEACKAAKSMLVEELTKQQNEVERRLKPLLQFDRSCHCPDNCIVSSPSTSID